MPFGRHRVPALLHLPLHRNDHNTNKNQNVAADTCNHVTTHKLKNGGPTRHRFIPIAVNTADSDFESEGDSPPGAYTHGSYKWLPALNQEKDEKRRADENSRNRAATNIERGEKEVRELKAKEEAKTKDVAEEAARAQRAAKAKRKSNGSESPALRDPNTLDDDIGEYELDQYGSNINK